MLEWEKPELEQLSLFAFAQLLCSVVLLTNHELPGNILFQNGNDMILPTQRINLEAQLSGESLSRLQRRMTSLNRAPGIGLETAAVNRIPTGSF